MRQSVMHGSKVRLRQNRQLRSGGTSNHFDREARNKTGSLWFRYKKVT